MAETNWRNSAIVSLANDPQKWRPLGEVFIAAVDAMPMHMVLRSAATVQRRANKYNGITETIQSTDLDIHKAQWSYFTAFVLPLVERPVKNKHSTRDELVRLKPSDPCKDCGGPTYLASWGGKSKHTYTCPACVAKAAKPKLTIVPATPAPAPIPAAKVSNLVKQPTLRLITPTKAKTVRPAPPPPQEPYKVRPLSEMNSLKEVWEEFRRGSAMPQFQQNPKLYRAIYRAFESGTLDEYKRMTMFRQSELALLQYPNGFIMSSIWSQRGTQWVDTTLIPHRRRRWGSILVEAYGFGALAILSLAISNKLHLVHSEMDIISAKLEPPRKQPKQVKTTWMTPVKVAANKVISRFRTR